MRFGYGISLCLLALVLSLSSCKKLLTFDIGLSSSFSIPSTVLVDAPINLPTPDVTTNAEQEFEENDTRAKYIDEIHLTELKLTITSPENQTFSPLKHLYIYINTEGLVETRVAYYENIPPDVGKELLMNLDDTDLEEYIKKEKFKLRVQVVTDETFFSNISITADMNYRVKAKNPVCGN